MSVKGIRVRYAKFITLLSIFKGKTNINLDGLEKCEMQFVLLSFNSKFELSAFLNLRFLEICGDV